MSNDYRWDALLLLRLYSLGKNDHLFRCQALLLFVPLAFRFSFRQRYKVGRLQVVRHGLPSGDAPKQLHLGVPELATQAHEGQQLFLRDRGGEALRKLLGQRSAHLVKSVPRVRELLHVAIQVPHQTLHGVLHAVEEAPRLIPGRQGDLLGDPLRLLLPVRAGILVLLQSLHLLRQNVLNLLREVRQQRAFAERIRKRVLLEVLQQGEAVLELLLFLLGSDRNLRSAVRRQRRILGRLLQLLQHVTRERVVHLPQALRPDQADRLALIHEYGDSRVAVVEGAVQGVSPRAQRRGQCPARKSCDHILAIHDAVDAGHGFVHRLAERTVPHPRRPVCVHLDFPKMRRGATPDKVRRSQRRKRSAQRVACAHQAVLALRRNRLASKRLQHRLALGRLIRQTCCTDQAPDAPTDGHVSALEPGVAHQLLSALVRLTLRLRRRVIPPLLHHGRIRDEVSPLVLLRTSEREDHLGKELKKKKKGA
eukprot:scaffold317_cov260-Pinguiococcus_pyrenoidosus.AAC.30